MVQMSRAKICVFMAKATTCAERCQFVTIVLLGLADAHRCRQPSLTLTKPKRSGGGLKSVWDAVKRLGNTLLLMLNDSVVCFCTLVCKSRIFRFTFLNKCFLSARCRFLSRASLM